MKNPTLRLLIATILAACFTSALFADDTDTKDTLCSGPWKFTKNSGGWETIRVFNKNGTFSTPINASETGKWKITGGTIVLTFADGHKDVMTLPLNPRGTQAFSAHADALTAVLQPGPAPGVNISALLPTATPVPLTEQQIAAAKTLLTSAPWKISGGGWADIRIFDPNGTFKTLAYDKEHGQWRIAGNKIMLDFADGHHDTISLPLDPKGTPGTSRGGSVTTAVLQDPNAVSSTPAPQSKPSGATGNGGTSVFGSESNH